MGHICCDRRVLAGLAIGLAGIAIVAPNLVVTALPLILLAACPLSMLVMAKTMGVRRRSPVALSDDPPAIDARYRVEPSVDGAGELAALQAQLRSLGKQQTVFAEQIERIEQAARALPDGRPAASTSTTRG